VTPQEWREGFRRLAILAAVVIVIVSALAIAFIIGGATLRRGFAVSCSLASIPLLLGGVIVHTKGEAKSRAPQRTTDAGYARHVRRSHDRSALGLMAAGAALFAIAMALG
jgi:hypothetical protein